MKEFIEKIKSDKTFRNRFVGIIITCVIIILATAIIIPVCVHNSKVATEVENTTLIETTTEPITLPEGIETQISEENGTTAVVGVTDENGNYISTTLVPTTTEAITETLATTAVNNSSNKTSTTTKKATTTKAPVKATTPATTQKAEWTEEDVRNIIADAKAYARSTGHIVRPDSDFRIARSEHEVYQMVDGVEYGTTWSAPTWTNGYERNDKNYNRILNSVKYQIDDFDTDPIGILLYRNTNYWEIFVVC